MSEWKPPRESDYTPARPHCPHTEWWSTENSFATEVEVSELIAALVRACQPEFVVEVGAHYGQTTANIARAIAQNGHGYFVSLEIDQGLFESASHRCQGLQVELVRINSLEYIPPRLIDFLFIDGGDYRDQDTEHLLPYLSERAIVAVHDLANDWYGRHWPRFLELLGDQCLTIDSPRGLAIWKRGPKYYGFVE